MNRLDILEALDAEIARLQQARNLLAESSETSRDSAPVRRGPGRPKGSGAAASTKTRNPAAKRTMSTEGRARIATAQKARWAKPRKPAKKSAPEAAKKGL